MKRHQFFFDETERDLLLCALNLWIDRLGTESGASSIAHGYAREFTGRQIVELKAKLEKPDRNAMEAT